MRTQVDPVDGGTTRRELFRLFLHERREPEPFYEALATYSLRDFPFPLDGVRVLDLGSGPGHFSRTLMERGAEVLAVDMDPSDVRAARDRADAGVVSDCYRLPIPDGSVGGVFCSNMLEHVPDPVGVLEEINRVLRPGGWAWVSFMNWYSPFGGHSITPMHFLGADRGLRVWRRLFGEPAKNIPYEGLWPTHVGSVLELATGIEGLRLVDAAPRYYPSQRWILKIPGFREVATWNLLMEFVRDADPN